MFRIIALVLLCIALFGACAPAPSQNLAVGFDCGGYGKAQVWAAADAASAEAQCRYVEIHSNPYRKG